jgi:Fur family ferric uptake transcriptional regulator
MTKKINFYEAEELLRKGGARFTAARVRVLAFLLIQNSAITHQQIEIGLHKYGKFDRVTLYRTLDWLIKNKFVHKVMGVNRVWLFRVNDSDASHYQHAHFKCNRCEKVVCLDSEISDSYIPSLPNGYCGMEIELTVKGLCAECV